MWFIFPHSSPLRAIFFFFFVKGSNSSINNYRLLLSMISRFIFVQHKNFKKGDLGNNGVPLCSSGQCKWMRHMSINIQKH